MKPSVPPSSHARTTRVALLALAAALLSALAAWTGERLSPRPPVTIQAPLLTANADHLLPPSPSPTHSPSPSPALTPTPDPDPLRHPITPEHLRLYRDVDLLDAAWQALKARDFPRARASLAQHKSEYPSAHDDLNEGLSLLADCMEQPSAQTRERAQRFYDEQTHSMARRRIRRECLEVVR
jgi:hypothetical protein